MRWHQDTFDLPDGALWLARSERYPHQAFRLGEHGERTASNGLAMARRYVLLCSSRPQRGSARSRFQWREVEQIHSHDCSSSSYVRGTM
jgi:hypothetical protein